MTVVVPIAKPATRAPRAKLAPRFPGTPPAPTLAAAALVETPAGAALALPSAPEPIALRDLRRAPENVRHTRPDEDVEQLADDIGMHGLLTSLIGYRDGDLVMIVGGGRRFQALRLLCDRFAIALDYAVPVLIRDRADAIELSLAENLQQRTMSPVDEFLAFRALMDLGGGTAADLAKRFGWKERAVRQRLRLAELAPPVLDALADRAITLDAAMAYATTQDRQLQTEVFAAEQRKGWEPHRVGNIRHALQMKAVKTDSPLFTFVGAESYERRGGGYEDDLFIEKDAERILANPFTLETAAREMIDFQMLRVLPEWQRRDDLAPTIGGYVIDHGVRLNQWRSGEKATAPKGWVKVECTYRPDDLWTAIRRHQVDVRVLVGVDQKGELAVWRQVVFVAKADRAKIEPKPSAAGHAAPAETPEQRAARDREAGILRHARRLAVGPFAGTPFEGRAYWPTDYWLSRPEAKTIGGVEGQLVPVQIFVTDEDVKAQRAAAEAAYQAELDARATEEAGA